MATASRTDEYFIEGSHVAMSPNLVLYYTESLASLPGVIEDPLWPRGKCKVVSNMRAEI
jgi:hypothetical protein